MNVHLRFPRWAGVIVLGLGLAHLLSSLAHAQTFAFHNMDTPFTHAGLAPDLKLPTEVAGPSTALSPMQIYKPEGSGPFPALVLLHTCGGLQDHVFAAAQQALSKGYVVLVLDSFSQRQVDMVCMSWKNGVTFARGVRDVLMAAERLRDLPFVDASKVAMVGFSWGGIVGVLAASQQGIRAAGRFDPFNAITAFYPGCQIFPGGATPPYSVISKDIQTSLLVLMGEKDTETPASECLKELEPAKQGGANVTWHVYDGASHVWDSLRLNGFRKTDRRGNHVEYHYSAATTADSYLRMFSHFEKSFTSR